MLPRLFSPTPKMAIKHLLKNFQQNKIYDLLKLSIPVLNNLYNQGVLSNVQLKSISWNLNLLVCILSSGAKKTIVLHHLCDSTPRWLPYCLSPRLCLYKSSHLSPWDLVPRLFVIFVNLPWTHFSLLSFLNCGVLNWGLIKVWARHCISVDAA